MQRLVPASNTSSCAHARAGRLWEKRTTYTRENERAFVSHAKEHELSPEGHGKAMKDFRQINEVTGFAGFSGCRVETG